MPQMGGGGLRKVDKGLRKGLVCALNEPKGNAR